MMNVDGEEYATKYGRLCGALETLFALRKYPGNEAEIEKVLDRIEKMIEADNLGAE